ncbi:MAG: HipA domain-containing protein [Gemmatimonadales bacterium]|nr:HipA domain-containing protein [Gemmatimonadales bacterium]MDZ4388383.1 HipA domain-containing protein [Gemmatimonadales bacterium]
MPRRRLRADTTRPMLAVYRSGRQVGAAGRDPATDEFWFQYDPALLATCQQEWPRWQLSLRLPLRDAPYGEAARVFFENLLVEGVLRDDLAAAIQRDPKDVAGLLNRVGAECAGDVQVWPTGLQVPPPSYTPFTVAELHDLFVARHGERHTEAQLRGRQGMSGTQAKLVFWRQAIQSGEALYQLPESGAPTTVIIKRPSGRHPWLVENEWVCQRLALAVGLPAADTAILSHPSGRSADALLMSRRHDRIEHEGGIARVHQEDICQALGVPSGRKYQHDRGPGLRDIANLLRQKTADPVQELERLAKMVLLHVVIGNMDAHAKNYALLYTGARPTLAPVYDALSTWLYRDLLGNRYAMQIGSAPTPDQLHPAAFERLSRDLGSTSAQLRNWVEQVLDGVHQHLPELLRTAQGTTGPSGYAAALAQVIAEQTRHLQRAAAPPPAGRQ